MKRREFIPLAGLGLLAGCGFHLRQAPDFAFNSLVMNAANTSPLANELRRQLASNGKVTVLTMATAGLATAPGTLATPVAAASPGTAFTAGSAGTETTAAQADAAASAAAALPGAANRVIFDLLSELREKIVVGLNSTGQVREFQLRSRIHFRLRTPAGKELIPDTELLQQRDISFNEGAVLSKEAEEGLLYRDMQSDLVQQILRRLAAIKSL
jgi:LPS-assembly lipoprotein